MGNYIPLALSSLVVFGLVYLLSRGGKKNPRPALPCEYCSVVSPKDHQDGCPKSARTPDPNASARFDLGRQHGFIAHARVFPQDKSYALGYAQGEAYARIVSAKKTH